MSTLLRSRIIYQVKPPCEKLNEYLLILSKISLKNFRYIFKRLLFQTTTSKVYIVIVIFERQKM